MNIKEIADGLTDEQSQVILEEIMDFKNSIENGMNSIEFLGFTNILSSCTMQVQGPAGIDGKPTIQIVVRMGEAIGIYKAAYKAFESAKAQLEEEAEE